MRSKDVIVTKHAFERYRERVKFITNYATLREQAYKAMTEGISACHDEALSPLIRPATEKHGGVAYYLEGVFYLFKDAYLTTVYTVDHLKKVG